MYKEQYHKQYGCYPEIVDTEFILHTDEVKCVLPCLSSSKCDCLHGWDVIQLNDTNEVSDIKVSKLYIIIVVIGPNE